MSTRTLRIAGIVLAVAALLIGYAVSRLMVSERAPGMGGLGGDFTLQSARGPISLAQFRGQVVPIYFGYTYCPDACPMSLANLGMAMRRLPEEARSQIQPIFISIDPERDTPQRLAEYVTHFDARMLGLTGSPEEVAAVARRYGVYYKAQKTDAQDQDYLVDHTSRTYVVDRNGELLAPLPHATPIDEVAQALRDALR